MADFSHFKSSFVQKSRSSLCRIEQLVQVSRVDDCLHPVKRAFDGQFQCDFLWVAHWFVVVDSWRILVTTESAMTAASMQKQKATVDCCRGSGRWKHRMSWNQSDLSSLNADGSWQSWQHQIGTNRAISKYPLVLSRVLSTCPASDQAQFVWVSFYGLLAHLEQTGRKQRCETPNQVSHWWDEPADKITRMGDMARSITSDSVFIRGITSKITTKTMINTVLIVTWIFAL